MEQVERSLARGVHPVGVWSHLMSADTVELAAVSGCDFVVLDLQHGMGGPSDLKECIRSATLHSVYSLARVSGPSPSEIGRALDCGAGGVIVPSVRSIEEARVCSKGAYYPPLGTRSWSPMWTGVRHSAEPDPHAANSSVECWIMVETAEAFRDRFALLEIPTVTGLFVGPNDLALNLDLGRVSPSESPELADTIAAVLESGRAAQKPVGVYCSSPSSAAYWVEAGASFVTVGRDAAIFLSAVRQAISTARAPLPGPR